MSEPFVALSGRYQLHETLAGGSESLVCRAYDPTVPRWVAIKTPNDARRADPERLRGFLEPARALAAVASPYVVQIHELIEAGQVDDRPYLVSEWLDTCLAEVMIRGAMPPVPAERLLRNLATGLRDLHQAGVPHRDLNPGNILVSNDLVQVRIADPGGCQTFPQAAQYSAPELYRPDQEVDARADLFALGMIAYELLLGPERFREVFAEIYQTDEAQHNTCWMNWQLDSSRAAPPLASLNPTIPRALSDWVANLLEKDPARRCPDAATALERLGQEEVILQPDLPPRRPSKPELVPVAPLWKRPGFIAVVALVWVVLPLGLYWMFREDPDRVKIETVLLPEVNALRKAAVAEGAEHPPPVAGLIAGDAAKAEAKAAFDEKDYPVNLSRLEAAKASFRQAVAQAQARNQHAEQARDASAKLRAQALQAVGSVEEARFQAADARHQAGLVALPPKNAPVALTAFEQAQAGFQALVAEAAVRMVRERMAAEQDAATVTVDLGGTPADVRAAQALCRRYRMSTADCQAELADEPPRRVTLHPATLDPTEVTRSAFARFAQQTGYRTEAEERGYSYLWGALGAVKAQGATWRTGGAAPDQDSRPVTHVTRQDALNYCQWAGQHLPSEDEWEYAARGSERRLFPWGADWEDGRAIWGSGGAEPVGARPAGATPEGLQDLAGNVWEWTATPAPGGADGLAKGGAYLDRTPLRLRAAARLIIDPAWSFADLGFRCAQ